MKKTIKPTKEKTLEYRASQYMERIGGLAINFELNVRPIILFPNPKSIYARLAVFFLRKSKATFDTQFSNLMKK